MTAPTAPSARHPAGETPPGRFVEKIHALGPAHGILLRVVSGALTCGLVLAGPGEPIREQPAGQRIVLKGDSIAEGYGFGDPRSPSPLRSLQGIAGILLAENPSVPSAFVSLPTIWRGLNPDGSAKTVDTLSAEMRAHLDRGELRKGDWLVFEDAGTVAMGIHPVPYPWTRDIYNEYRRSVRGLVLAVQGVVGRDRILLMTMFDYEPRCTGCRWDALLDDGIHTANDAIRDEARALGIACIDMNAIMDAVHRYLTEGKWGRPVGPDGIHPNVYGNYVMTLAIFASVGVDTSRWSLDGLHRRFQHPETGGDIPAVWGFDRDPTDGERLELLRGLRTVVLSSWKVLR